MRKLKLYSLVILLALSFALPTAFAQRKAGKPPAATPATIASARGVETISAAQLKNYLYFIASDEMEGRDTPSRGLDTTAKFIAMNLERWGFKPAGDDDTFFQHITLRRDILDGAHSVAEINGQKFSYGEDFLPNAIGGAPSQPVVDLSVGLGAECQHTPQMQDIDPEDQNNIVVCAMMLPTGTR